MENHKKKVLVLISCILILIALVAILLGIIFKDDEEDKPKNEPSNNTSNVISKEISRLNDSEEFFGIQRALNDFYLMLINKNTDAVMQLLDKDFIQEKNINTNNLFDVIKSDYENTSFIVKQIYYNPNSSLTYYFINGYLIDMKMLDEDNSYEDSINYLIIKNSANNYVIRPLDNINIEGIARNYNIVDKTIQNNYLLSFNRVSEENKLTTYINEFMNLLEFDNKRAYELLDDVTKNKYANYEDFNNKYIEIYELLSSKIFSYSSKDSGSYKIYNIIDDKQNNITIYENNIMDYKIGY